MRSRNASSSNEAGHQHHHHVSSNTARDGSSGPPPSRMFGPDHRMGIPGTLHRSGQRSGVSSPAAAAARTGVPPSSMQVRGKLCDSMHRSHCALQPLTSVRWSCIMRQHEVAPSCNVLLKPAFLHGTRAPHRISAFFTSSGAVSGLTYRVGRHVPGAAAIFGDVLNRVSGLPPMEGIRLLHQLELIALHNNGSALKARCNAAQTSTQYVAFTKNSLTPSKGFRPSFDCISYLALLV
jgi:hypothetical protein